MFATPMRKHWLRRRMVYLPRGVLLAAIAFSFTKECALAPMSKRNNVGLPTCEQKDISTVAPVCRALFVTFSRDEKVVKIRHQEEYKLKTIC